MPRAYTQTRRAEAAQATGERILAATIELFLRDGDVPTLDAVATQAEVSVQTVLRRFGSKQGLFEAAVEAARGHVGATRGAAPVGDVPGAVANLLDHYAEWGDNSLRLLALAKTSPAAAEAVREGREVHRAWVERVFAPLLDGVPADERPRRVLQLVAATDVYVWGLLHRDLGHPRGEVEATVADLVTRILA